MGIISDKELGQQIGCTESNVRYRRKHFNINPALYAGWTTEDNILLVNNLAKCVNCFNHKLLCEFTSTKSKRRTGCRRICKECMSKQDRHRRMTNKKDFIKKMGEHCQCCGYNKSIGALQFHHVGEKSHNPSKLVVTNSRKTDAYKELNECCLLCSNCHDAFHSSELKIMFKKKDGLGYTVLSSAEQPFAAK